ncbi:MAG: 50S ribosomal protein L24 [Candidatus Porifericomitaceae bacterium WSBS_2022_MAG_OTU9]
MRKLRKGDEVMILAGKDRGRTGKILRVATMRERVVVEGVNMVRKHVKPNPSANKPGGIEDQERPLHVSNVALLNPVTNKPDKIGFKFLEDGRKVRYFRSSGEVVDS